jgi:hypothetical protein
MNEWHDEHTRVSSRSRIIHGNTPIALVGAVGVAPTTDDTLCNNISRSLLT